MTASLVSLVGIIAHKGNKNHHADNSLGQSVPYVGFVKINPYGSEPLYRQLASILRQQIESGMLRHLDPLPSETTLTQQYDLSRDTVRRAIALLRDEGLIFTLGQRGSYVGPRPKE